MRGWMGRLVVVGMLALLPALAMARDAGTSTRAFGMGDAVHALGMGLAGLYFNPATLVQQPMYEVNAGYGYQQLGGIHNVHASILDSQTNTRLAGAFGYTYGWSRKGGSDLNSHDIRAALASFVGEGDWRMAFGGGFRYVKVSDTGLSMSGPTMDAGILLAMQQMLFFGVSGQNLIAVSGKRVPRLLGIGVGTAYTFFRVGVDTVIDFETRDEATASPALGVEFVIQEMVAVRSGFTWDRVLGQKRLTGGIGYISKVVGLDVGYAHDLTHLSNWQLEASLRFFIP